MLSSIPFRALLTTTAALAVLIPAQPAQRADAASRPQVRQGESLAAFLTARSQPAATRAVTRRAALATGRSTLLTGRSTLTGRMTLVAGRAVPVTRRSAVVMRAGKVARARARVVAYARAQKGDWYQFGAEGPSRWDCSGLIRRSMAQAGIRLAHSSRAQARRGKRVASRHARPGDLVVYNGHIGILSGRWRMVDAPGRGRRVVERKVYRDRSLHFRRVIQ